MSKMLGCPDCIRFHVLVPTFNETYAVSYVIVRKEDTIGSVCNFFYILELLWRLWGLITYPIKVIASDIDPTSLYFAANFSSDL